MAIGKVRATREVIARMKDAAVRANPMECCGLLAGTNSVVTVAYPLRNESLKPRKNYFASPEDLLAAMRRIRDSGQTMMGIYHSHPTTPAYPSTSDVEMAFYPDVLYFIISLMPKIDLRAFEINKKEIAEAEIEVIDGN